MATRISQAQLNKFISPEAAMAPYERFQQDKTQRSSQDAALAQLIKGDELKREGDRANFDMAKQYVADERGEGRSVNASINGASVQQKEVDPLANWLKVKQVNALDEDKAEKRTNQFAERAEKFNIPKRAADLVSVESATRSDGAGGILTNPDYQVKSASKALGYTPDFLKPLVQGAGEKLGLLPEGTGTEMQALQRLYNTEIKSNSGSAVSMQEEGRNLISTGQRSGDPDKVRQGVQMIKRALELDTHVLEGSSAARTKEQFRSQGGEYDVNRMLGNPGAPAASHAPKPGEVHDGYVFHGGDPSNSKNWSKR